MVINKSKNQQIMILGNPSTRRDSFFVLSILCLFLFTAFHTRAQGIIGFVTESSTHHPVPNAYVSLFRNDSLYQQVLTDSTGHYRISTLEAGRFSIVIEVPGYALLRDDDLLLDGYAVLRLEHLLQNEAVMLQTVSVVSSRRKFEPATILIHPDDLLTVAGNFEDPVRILHSQPGVVLLNDQSNQFSLRGQSPVFNTWQLEGLEITNPSHTSNAGTLSDRPTQSGGGINMFSAQMLGSTVVYTGLNPMHTGRTAGAVINMHLHETTRDEWRARAGLIGLEFGGGTSFSEKSVLDFNLRYSFTGLLSNLGVDFGGEKISFYDGVVSWLHRGESHRLKVFGWAGNSINDFEKPETPERFKDFFDIRYENDVYGAGMRYDLLLGDRTQLQSGLAYSTTSSAYTKTGTFEDENTAIDDAGETSVLSGFFTLMHQLSSTIQAQAGIDMVNRMYEGEPSFHLPFADENKLRFNLGVSIQVSRHLLAELGGEAVLETITDDENEFRPGGRAMLKWNPAHRLQIFAGGRYSSSHTTVIGLTDVTSLESGATLRLTNHVFGITGYLQQVENAPARIDQEGDLRYYAVDLEEPFMTGGSALNNYSATTSRGYGIEGKWHYSGGHGWSWQFNQSLFKTERELPKRPFDRGHFDGGWATHAMVAKEWVRTRGGKQRTWNVSLRGIFNGGLWEQRIDENGSDNTNATRYVRPGNFTEQLPAFKRVDMSLSRTTAFPKSRIRWMIDIQNAFSLTNIAYHYYDPYLHRIEPQKHLGIIPVLSLQIAW
jgi:hypothetical protein